MKFEFFIGGYDAGHFEMILRDDEELCFFVSDYPMRTDYASPTHTVSIKDDPDWSHLIRFASNLKWKTHYDSDVLDGIQWELTVTNEGREISYYGSNKFPRDFDKLTKLIRTIADKHKIPSHLVRR